MRIEILHRPSRGGHLCKRLKQIITAELRYSFGSDR